MRILLVLIAVLASPAHADQLATAAGVAAPLVRLFSDCKNCKIMEEVRTTVFVPVHKNLHLKAKAQEAVGWVHESGDVLKSLDEAQLRSAHYANEVESYMLLASDAIPYDEGIQVAEDIAYFNIVIGTRDIYNRALSKIENGCRKEFLIEAVNAKECILRKDLELEKAEIEGRAPQKTTCPLLKTTISDCEAKRAARVK